MKKSPLIFLLCIAVSGFIFKNEIISRISGVTASWVSLPNIPYTLSHNVTVAADTAGSKILIIGGIAGDSISSRVLQYNTASATYDITVPKLPRRLMNGFGFRIKDSIYYGGGYTTNWGDTTFSSDTLYDCFTSGTTGYVTGQGGKIYLTTNNFLNWRVKQIPFTSRNVVAISMINNLRGYFIGNKNDSSSVYFTSDSAANFSKKFTYRASSLNDLFFINEATGWACGNAGVISRTIDSGATWNTQIFESNNYKSVSFVNASTGYICGANGKVIKTTNGGINWASLTTNTTKSLSSIVCDSAYAYACGDDATIIKTTNSGASWASQTTNTILNFRSIEKINSNKIIVSGDRGIILYTTNAGAIWNQRPGVSSNSLNKIFIEKGDSIPKAVGVNGWITKANRPFFEYMIMDMFFKINVNNLAAGWQMKAALPISIAEVFSSACTVNDRFAYVMGGRTSGFNYCDSVMMYNHFSNTWSFKKRLPEKISESGVAVVGRDKIIVAGGKKSDSISSKVYIGTVDSMNAGSPGLISWTASSTSLPVPTYAMGSKGFPSKKIAFFIGGNTSLFSFSDAPNTPTTKIYMYETTTNRFTELQTDGANLICHTGVDGCISELPSTASSSADTSVKIFAPGGRDSNYLSVNLHKLLQINGLVGVQQISSGIPSKYILAQNYPNPFNPSTKITYEIPKNDFVEFKVFDLLGKEVTSFSSGFQKAGKYEITFDGKSLSSGVYFYQLKTNNFSDTRKMLLVK